MKTSFLTAVVLFFGCQIQAQVWLESTVIDTQVVAKNLEIPWEMEAWGNDTILFTQRSGSICRLSLISGQIDTMYLPDIASDVFAAEGQSGMLGMQTHPDFPNTPYVYVALTYYPDFSTSIRLAVLRLKYNAAADVLEKDSTIVSNIASANTNIGGRLLITSDNYLLLSVGDIKETGKPQDINSLNGKMLRYHLNGSIPNTNPIPNSPIFSLGHRNPQGIAEDNEGNIWISEHGQSSNDELNKLENGRNYGWPLVTGNCTSASQSLCDSLNMAEPYETWSPTIAPAGLVYFNESSIPEWQNSLLIACLKEQRIMVSHFNTDKSAVTHSDWVFQYQFGRIRDILLMPNGRLFVCTSNRDVLGEPVAQDDIIMELIPSQHNGIAPSEKNTLTYQIQENNVLLSQNISGHAALFSIDGRLLQTITLNQTNRIALQSNRTFSPRILRIETRDAALTIKLL
ncbi:MAG: PQQ-dependent sugar dehydrogenase [Salibacteraceae bacterium]|nr:PQQ-dependent sugar dehydrogenase [Salibacteraceae bacterium]